MLCDICKKNEATIHYKEFVGGKQKSLNVCAECAREHEKSAGLNFGSFNLAEMLYNLGKLAENGPASAEPETPMPDLKCPRCGRTVAMLKKSGGRMGCPVCYAAFAPIMEDVLGHVQRGRVHVGKRPGCRRTADGGAAAAARVIRLKQELAELVKAENYERAAQIRDVIRELEKNQPFRRESLSGGEA